MTCDLWRIYLYIMLHVRNDWVQYLKKKYHSALSSNEFSWNVQENYCNKSCLRVVNDADTILECMSYSEILKLPGKTNIYGAERCLGFHKYQLTFSKVFIPIRICQFSI